MSKDLDKDLDEFEGNLKEELYRELLEKAYLKINSLEKSLGSISEKEVNLRDTVAASVFNAMLDKVTSNEEAAEDSYRAADALLRVRETGHSFDSDIIDLLRGMRDTSNDDTVFGRTVRRFLKDR